MENTSCFLHSPMKHFLSSPSSSSSLSLSSRPFFFYLHNVQPKRRITRVQMAHLRPHLGPLNFDSCKRRAMLFLGFSIFPFFSWKDEAFHVLASGNEQISENENPKQELTVQKSAPPSPILSILNAIGILGSGVLGALWSIARKDKVASDAMIESLNSQLTDKDATIDSLKINFDAKLLHQQEELNKLLSKAKEEQLSLVNHLESANDTISGLDHELQSERRKVEELQGQIENLEMKLGEAGKYKQALEDQVKDKGSSATILQEKINMLTSEVMEKEDTVNSLSSSLAQKDSDLKNLNSAFKQTKDELDAIISEIVNLKDELWKNQNELEQKNSVVDDLSNSVNSLTAEQDSLIAKLGVLEHLYNNLQSFSKEKMAHDAELLEEMECELGQLREKYELAVSELSVSQSVISDMTQDRDDVKKMLDKEAEYVKTLKQELQSAEAALGSSKNEVSDLSKQLDESKRLSSELEAALSKAQAEFHQARESLQKSLNEATLNSEALASELASVKAALDKTVNELQVASSELAAMHENKDTLQKELAEAHKNAEAASNVWKEQRGVLTALNKEIQALKIRVMKDREARESLEADLEAATRSLDELARDVWIVAKDLEVAKTQVNSLVEEKDLLSHALEKEKKVAQEARENLKEAHTLVMRLGNERESLEKRAKKLEEDLTSAKGEIVRLSCQISSSKTVGGSKEPVDSEPSQEGEPADNVTFKEETEPAINSDTEQEVEPAVNKKSKRTVTATSEAPVKRSGRKKKANNQ